MAGERWVFTAEQLENTPSRKCGIDSDKETYYRQQAANFVQDMGQRLQVTQLCINTAIVYLHRFYMFHSFTKFHRNSMAEACLFLAAKVEEQPRKLEHVIKVAHAILHRDQGPLDTKSVAYLEHAQELVLNENILLQTLGFELQVDHPHKHIVETCNLIRAAKDLAQTSYFLATNSLHLTQMSLQYKPTFVASICIHLACKWAQFEIPRSNEGKEWFSYVDKSMTAEILEGLTQKFLSILDKCPTKFKKKLMSKTGKDEEIPGFTMPQEKKVKAEPSASATSGGHERGHGVNNHDPSTSGSKHPHKSSDHSKASAAAVSTAKTSDAVKQEGAMRRVKTESYLTSLSTKEYFERKEKERQERERIERERQKIAAEKEKEEKAAAAKAAKEAAMAAAAEKSKTSRHHTNIFEEMASGSAVKVEPAMENTTTVEKPKEKHSTERSNVSHSYKDKYHDKPDGAAAEKQAPRKLPFSVDYNKLQEYQRPKSSSSHSRHEGHSRSGYKSHGEHRSSHGAPPSEFRSQAERSHGSREQSRHEKRVENPVTEHKVPEAAVTAASSAAPKPPIDPEEGEILDDDSPPDLSVKKHLSSSSSSHGHRHHHRERRSSGHHHHTSPASASAAATSGEQRRKSPRNGRKEEAAPTSHHKKHAEEAPSVVPTPAPLPIDVDKLFEDVRRPTPEPGEIVEKQQQQQQQSHKHHKSSHKSHKKRNKEREDPTSGSLKMKIDLKGVGKIPSPATDDRKSKEVKLKIKPVTGDPAATSSQPRDGKVRTSSSTKPQEHHHKVRESPSSLKVKLKLPSSATTTGNGETEAHTPKDQKSLSGSSSSIKLVLSKDSLGQYTPTGSGSSSSHKSHKHSDKSSSSSRKRPFSPSDAGAPLKHKLARNDSSSGLVTRPAVELPGSVSGSPLTGAPFTGTPSRESLSTTMSLMDALIKQKAGELYQRAPSNSSKKHRHATPPSDNPDIL